MTDLRIEYDYYGVSQRKICDCLMLGDFYVIEECFDFS